MYLYYYKFNLENYQRFFDIVSDENWYFRLYIIKFICCLFIFVIYQFLKNVKIVDIMGFIFLMEVYGFVMVI